MNMLSHQDLMGRIIGAAIEVHKALGPGFLESRKTGTEAEGEALLSGLHEFQIPKQFFYKCFSE